MKKKFTTWVAEFFGSFTASYIKTSARLKKQEIMESSTDFCPEETKQFISKSLEACRPVSKDLTWLGRTITKYNLDKNNYLKTLIGIDTHTKSTKRTMCIAALKTAARCICSGYNADSIRAATYNYLALRPHSLD
jgi:hypothetical protein